MDSKAAAGMVAQAVLHRPMSDLIELRRVGPNHHSVGDRGRTGNRRPAHPLDFDDASTATGVWLQPFEIAEMGNGKVVLQTNVQETRTFFRLDLLAVDL